MTDWVDAAKNLSLNELGDAITHISLHTAYPGTTGTSEVAGGSPAYSREGVTWDVAASGSKASSGALDFDVPAGTTVAWAGLWTAATGGTFLGSSPLGPVGDPKIATIDVDDVFTAPGHTFTNGQTIVIGKTLGALPTGTGLSDGAVVFVRDVSGDTFKVAVTSGGGAINVTASGVAMVRAITTEIFGGQGTYTITTLTLNLA